jgi:methionyl-tRNA formyltransferase
VSTVYVGTSDFAVTVLERLAESRHRPALVVTRPDRPKGRGRRMLPPPVAPAARGLGIEVIQPEDLGSREVRDRIAAADPEAVCVCAYGAMIREPLLSEHPLLNVHPSLLPRWRGAAPVERAIAAGDTQTGVSIISLVAELDAGPIHLARAEPIAADDDYGSLAPRLARLGGELLVETLDTRPEPRPQAVEGLTYAEKISPEERRLDPSRPPDELARTVRALNPHIGTWVETGPQGRLGVRRAAPAPEGPVPPPGELAASYGRLLLGADGGALELIEVKPPGGRAMAAPDYIRGHAQQSEA